MLNVSNSNNTNDTAKPLIFTLETLETYKKKMEEKSVPDTQGIVQNPEAKNWIHLKVPIKDNIFLSLLNEVEQSLKDEHKSKNGPDLITQVATKLGLKPNFPSILKCFTRLQFQGFASYKRSYGKDNEYITAITPKGKRRLAELKASPDSKKLIPKIKYHADKPEQINTILKKDVQEKNHSAPLKETDSLSQRALIIEVDSQSFSTSQKKLNNPPNELKPLNRSNTVTHAFKEFKKYKDDKTVLAQEIVNTPIRPIKMSLSFIT